jgi:archaemetzincin
MPSSRSLISSRFLNRDRTIGWPCILSQARCLAKIKDSRPNKPDGTRRKIYLQPLGEFPPGRSPSPERLREYATIYFGLETDTLPAVQGQDFATLVNPLTQNHQILTTDVLRFLMTKLPRDAFCVLAITMEDLYPEPAWNFVFGQASLRERVAVFSFARCDVAFYGQERAADHQTVLLRRSCKVLAHETAHMFGLAHCIFF